MSVRGGGHPPGLRGREIGLFYARGGGRGRGRGRGGSGGGGSDGAGGIHRTPEDRLKARVLRGLADDDPERLEVSDHAARVAREATQTLADSAEAKATAALETAGGRSAVRPILQPTIREYTGNDSTKGRGLPSDGTCAASERNRTILGSSAGPPRCVRQRHAGPLAEQRKKLPAWSCRHEIVDAIRHNQVIVVSGETGCGKTTQVPQFILDDEAASSRPMYIVCTQPRRISAIGVAERVAAERGEDVGRSIGYQIRLESAASRATALLFCTTGILLRRMQSDELLNGVSHVIVDEIHERSMDTDFLLILLRDILPRRPDLRVVLMSATLNADFFASYFGGCRVLHIPGFTYKVREYYLEDVIQLTQYRPDIIQSFSNGRTSSGMHTRGNPRERSRSGFRGSFKEQRMHSRRLRERNVDSEIDILRDTLGNSYSDETLAAVSTLMDYSDGSVPLELIALLLEYIDDNFGKGAVLVFLPGWEEISRLHEMLTGEDRRFANPRKYLLLPLHSSMPTANQTRIFNRPPPGTRKIVLATNIAETSLTIDDVVYVIDSGRFKEKTYEAATNVECLRPEWVSKASASQRRGRAGRVQEGVCYHLFSSQAHSSFKEYQEPEMLRAPLESLCLRVKSMRIPCVDAFLKGALDPPDSRAVRNALVMLRVIGALQPDKEDLTPLGSHLANIPVDPRLGKMLLYAVMFQCLDPILTIASSLGFRNPFTMPLNEKHAADRAKQVLAGGMPSDHAAVLCAYNRWREGGGQRFARQFYLSHPTLKMIDDMKMQFISILTDAGFISSPGSDADLNLNADNWPLVKGILVAGLFPSVARVNFGRNRINFFTRNDGAVKVHPGSVNNLHPPNFSHRWTVFYEKVRSTAIFLLDVTEVTPMALCLFGGPIELSLDKKRITIETGDGQIGSAASLPDGASRKPWVMFENTGDAGDVVVQLREQMDAALLRELSDPLRSERSGSFCARRPYVGAVTLLLEEAENLSFHNIQ